MKIDEKLWDGGYWNFFCVGYSYNIREAEKKNLEEEGKKVSK